MTQQGKTLIVGAGISGLFAGQILNQAGHPVTILEKSRGVGGRMATRRFNKGIFDHGAQFFTVRDPQFQRWVDHWMQQGIAIEWARKFSKPGKTPEGNSHLRYRGLKGMTSIPKELSQGLDIHLQTRVESISNDGEIWTAETAGGIDFNASQLILTAPVPQSLSLLEMGRVPLPEREMKHLQTIKYHPCIAVLVLLDGPSEIPTPGGMKVHSSPIQWLADNTQKGISPQASAVTIHASADFSQQNFDLDPDQLADMLIREAGPWLGASVQGWQLHKWRYSQPVQIYPERFLEISVSPSLFFVGDAFGGPRVEGGAMSGMAVGQYLIKKLRLQSGTSSE